MTHTDNSATLYNALRLIDNLQAQVETLRRERDEARAKLASGIHTYERNGTIFHEVRPSWPTPTPGAQA